MVKVRIETLPGKRIRAFVVSGHAGRAPYGQDIVCAGVSALTQAAVLGLEEYLGLTPEVAVREGYLACSLSQDEYWQEEAQAILATMVLGLKAMACMYPDSIRIEEVLG
jgi:uncharacterized protein YsxB (DUF464 family)